MSFTLSQHVIGCSLHGVTHKLLNSGSKPGWIGMVLSTRN